MTSVWTERPLKDGRHFEHVTGSFVSFHEQGSIVTIYRGDTDESRAAADSLRQQLVAAGYEEQAPSSAQTAGFIWPGAGPPPAIVPQ